MLYERDTASHAATRYNYGVTLRPWAYRPLLEVLRLDADVFRTKIAVDGPTGGSGRVGNHHSVGYYSPFRANRNHLEQLLREGLDVRWEHKLTGITSNGAGVTLNFANGQQLSTGVVIGADGPHSLARTSISPTTQFNVLPYAVYNGKRRVDLSNFKRKYAPYMAGANLVEHQHSDSLMRISVDESTPERVSISYTYSRPARQPSDPIFNPDRPNSGATDIPAALFDEIATLSDDLEAPFMEVFDVGAMKQDRLLNWLMRSVQVEKSDLDQAAAKGIILIGDASHHTPILGSEGANEAIKDAMDMAQYIASTEGRDLRDDISDERMNVWTGHVEDGEARLAEMHRPSKPNL